MAQIRFTMSNSEDWSPLPNGTYEIEIESVDDTQVSSNGHPQVVLRGSVVTGPYAGRSVSVWYTLTPKASRRFYELCEKLGLPRRREGVDAEGNAIIVGPDPGEFIGKRVVFDVTTRIHEGKEWNNFNNPRIPVSLQSNGNGSDDGNGVSAAATSAPDTNPNQMSFQWNAPSTADRRPRPRAPRAE
jgi:hypothetical protein